MVIVHMYVICYPTPAQEPGDMEDRRGLKIQAVSSKGQSNANINETSLVWLCLNMYEYFMKYDNNILAADAKRSVR